MQPVTYVHLCKVLVPFFTDNFAPLMQFQTVHAGRLSADHTERKMLVTVPATWAGWHGAIQVGNIKLGIYQCEKE